MAWLNLIRWQNLIIIFLTQLFSWGCVIMPMQHYSPVAPTLDWNYFLLLSLSTVLIAAAGYAINDYFDVKIDAINRPDKLILEKRIPMKLAVLVHIVLNLIAIFMAIVVARRAGHYSFVALQLGCTLMLWFYSTKFKREFVTGNVLVAVLTAFTIAVLMLYEGAIHYYLFEDFFIQGVSELIPNPVWVLGTYAYFAIMLTWMREIVKDMEDFKGDAEQGCVTMPIKWGLLRSARFTQVLGALTVTPLILGAIKLLKEQWYVLGIYTLLGLALPIILWMYYLPKEATTKHYHKESRWLKIIMVLGVVSLVIYYFQTNG
ncbi:MAG: geranylgeranylglycerol-phosphate geranylgeranyltransferase [Chitinophagales bacterium]|nr:geranylgeranylglycerol-phosphate geranylgeranyltransferase [Chitinophagaceae bacterium]MCB9065977.1 geranylgeranylglycerol-phosphate geranylgeranyltransferase [Chitinophagales bacterium]